MLVQSTPASVPSSAGGATGAGAAHRLSAGELAAARTSPTPLPGSAFRWSWWRGGGAGAPSVATSSPPTKAAPASLHTVAAGCAAATGRACAAGASASTASAPPRAILVFLPIFRVDLRLRDGWTPRIGRAFDHDERGL